MCLKTLGPEPDEMESLLPRRRVITQRTSLHIVHIDVLLAELVEIKWVDREHDILSGGSELIM